MSAVNKLEYVHYKRKLSGIDTDWMSYNYLKSST